MVRSRANMSGRTISTSQLLDLFPDQKAARKYLEGRLLTSGATCPECKTRGRITKRKSRLLPLQRMQTRFHNPYRDNFRAVACALTKVAIRDVPASHRAQGHLLNPVGERDRGYSEVGVVHPSPAPRGLRRQEQRSGVPAGRGACGQWHLLRRSETRALWRLPPC